MNILTLLFILLSLLLGVLAYVSHAKLKQLEQATKLQNEALKNQTYEIVHELRAPLTAVKDAAILLHDMPGKLTPEEQAKMLS